MHYLLTGLAVFCALFLNSLVVLGINKVILEAQRRKQLRLLINDYNEVREEMGWKGLN